MHTHVYRSFLEGQKSVSFVIFILFIIIYHSSREAFKLYFWGMFWFIKTVELGQKVKGQWLDLELELGSWICEAHKVTAFKKVY